MINSDNHYKEEGFKHLFKFSWPLIVLFFPSNISFLTNRKLKHCGNLMLMLMLMQNMNSVDRYINLFVLQTDDFYWSTI